MLHWSWTGSKHLQRVLHVKSNFERCKTCATGFQQQMGMLLRHSSSTNAQERHTDTL